LPLHYKYQSIIAV